MKNFKKNLFLVMLMMISVSVVAQKYKGEDEQAIKMLREFYEAYGATCALIASKGVPIGEKLDSLAKIYATRELLKQHRERSEFEEDVLTGDWGMNAEALKSLSVMKDTTGNNAFIVSYSIFDYPVSPSKPVKQNIILSVGVVKENGVYKIASVKDLTEIDRGE
jgi:hypothetical protein